MQRQFVCSGRVASSAVATSQRWRRSRGTARAAVPVLAATPLARRACQSSVAWGITPLLIPEYETTDDIVWFAVKAAADLGLVKTNDVVAVVVGTLDDPEPATDVLRLVRIR